MGCVGEALDQQTVGLENKKIAVIVDLMTQAVDVVLSDTRVETSMTKSILLYTDSKVPIHPEIEVVKKINMPIRLEKISRTSFLFNSKDELAIIILNNKTGSDHCFL